MKLPLSWLQDFTDVKKISAEKIAEALTLSGSEVETINRKSEAELKKFDKVAVGKILEIRKHPNADKLQIARVQIANSAELSIVCGASNIAVGQMVPAALIGASLPNGLTIERRKIRDIESEGMLCSAKELGLAEDAAEIHILSQDLKIGTPLAKALGLDEIVLDLDITPNRGDCLSIRGLAREVSAVLKKKPLPHPEFLLKSQKIKNSEIKNNGLRVDLKVQIEDKKLCPFYSARAVYDVKVGESPQWLKNRLLSVGIRPINNIVDITNYVMMELGQPLHAFDADKLRVKTLSPQPSPRRGRGQGEGVTIVVRRAKKGERVTALDNKVYDLTPETLVIADAQKPIAIAGIMGGKDSSVEENTKNIILEAAQFFPGSVRKTSKFLGLKSDSSYRFERGIDSLRVEQALGRAAELIEQLAGGARDKKLVSAGILPKPKTIKFKPEFISNRLGKEISTKEIKQILASLGFVPLTTNYKLLTIQIPSWRNEISIPEDIVEEIGRVIGYDKIAPVLVATQSKEQDAETAKKQEKEYSNFSDVKNIRDALFGAGFTESFLYSFYGKKHAELARIPTNDHFQVINPLNPDQEYLRAALLPRLLEAAQKNSARFESVKLFEIGRIFLPSGDVFPKEEKMLAAILANDQVPAIDNFRELKSVLALLFRRLGFDKAVFEKVGKSRAAIIKIKNLEAGICGLIGSKERAAFKLSDSTAFFEISLDKILSLPKAVGKIIPMSEFPQALRDISFVVDKNIMYERIEKIIKDSSPLLTGLEMFDYFEDEKKIGKDKKSLAFHLIFQLGERTLTSEEADDAMRKIIDRLEKTMQAQVRK